MKKIILEPAEKETLPRTVRVRLEYTAKPHATGIRFRTSPKLSFLGKLLEEKFGQAGRLLFRDWMGWTAKEQGLRGADQKEDYLANSQEAKDRGES